MFNFFKKPEEPKPILRNPMRRVQLDTERDYVWLYDFQGAQPNGYFIREELVHDMVVRGMLLCARHAVKGEMFVNEHGAGLVFASKLSKEIQKELCGEVQRLAAIKPL
ncbi:hypothetical protein [Synechococcus phage S-B68]|nr:hypothetical protein [Synechococcus phage S-B68]